MEQAINDLTNAQNTYAETLENNNGKLKSKLSEINQAIDLIEATINSINQTIVDNNGKIYELQKQISALTEEKNAMSVESKELKKNIADRKKEIDNLNQQNTSYIDVINKAIGALKNAGNQTATDEFLDNMTQILARLNNLNQKIKDKFGSNGPTNGPTNGSIKPSSSRPSYVAQESVFNPIQQGQMTANQRSSMLGQSTLGRSTSTSTGGYNYLKHNRTSFRTRRSKSRSKSKSKFRLGSRRSKSRS